MSRTSDSLNRYNLCDKDPFTGPDICLGRIPAKLFDIDKNSLAIGRTMTLAR